jgi:DNA-directed RNA polymerase delta subunit
LERGKIMKDLMQDTEFVKLGKDRWIEKGGTGRIYTTDELKKLFKKNDKEVKKEKVKENKDEIENDIKSETE